MRSRIAGRLFGSGAVPVRLGRYVLEQEIGAGGMGVVYRAHDAELGRNVAVKLLRADAASERVRARLHREARALASLNHPNVVQIYEIGQHGAELFFAMEYVAGNSAKHWLEAGPHPWQECLDVFLQAGDGLFAAHSVGIVHRDFKPGNVLIGEDGRVRVADFGLALGTDSSEVSVPDDPSASGSTSGDRPLTKTGAILGTPAYMPPEQRSGAAATPASDQFSFCASVWEAVVGRLPYTPAEIRAGQGRLQPPGRSIPAWVVRALARGLSMSPADRWPSLDALLQELRTAPSRRRRMTVATSAFVAGALWLAVSQDGEACDVDVELLRSEIDPPAIRQRLRQVAHASEAGATTIVQRLDEFEAAWRAEASAYCRDPRGRTSAVHECLLRSAGSLRLVAAGFLDAPALSYEHAGRVLAGLRPPTGCRSAVAGSQPESAEDYADVDAAAVLTSSGRAEAGRRRALVAQRGAGPEAHSVRAEASFELGRARRMLSDPPGAMTAYLEAAAAGQASGRVDLLARTWSALVEIAAFDLEDLDRAHEWARLAAGLTASGGLQPTLRAGIASALAELDRAAANPISAEVRLRTAVRYLRDADATDGDAYGEVVRRLANVVADTGRFDEARGLYAEATEFVVDQYGEEHPTVASLELNLSLLARSEGDPELQRVHAEKAVRICERHYGDRGATLAAANASLAEAEIAAARFRLAVEAATRSWDAARASLPSDHSEYTMGLALRGQAQLEAEAWEESFADFSTLEELQLTRGDPEVIGTRTTLAWLATQLGHIAEARRYYDLVERDSDPDSYLADYLAVGRAAIALAEGHQDEAARIVGPLYDRLIAEGGDGSEFVAEAAWILAHADRARAPEFARQAIAQYEMHAPNRHERIAAAKKLLPP